MNNQEKVKPKVKLTGTDGNIFSILGKCTKALRSADQNDKAKELSEKIFNMTSYEAALALCMEYVEVS